MDDVTRYALDVRAGRIVAGKPVRLACERHLRDVDRQPETGLYWRPEIAAWVIQFFAENLTVEVDNEVRPFVLEPFQRFIVGSLFGWFNGDGTRRFRTAYVEIGKGNGKSPLAAGIGHYGLIADGQVSPEIYCAATTTDQAKVAWNDAKLMAERSPDLSAELEINAANLFFPKRNGVFRPVSSEHRGLDGKRVHMALIDEVHEHPTSLVVDKMRAGTKARRNALIFEITNSGSDLETVCGNHHDYSLKVLEGIYDDPSWFAYVCSLDLPRTETLEDGTEIKVPGDDWRDETVWQKANPGLGSILPIQYLREQVREAQGMPTKQSIVKRLNFCIWTQAASPWLDMDQWDACTDPVSADDLAGQPCWVGLDLSTKLDLTALVLAFRHEDCGGPGLEVEVTTTKDGKNFERKKLNLNYRVSLLPFFWIPEETMHQRAREDRIQYPLWQEQGFLRVTPGNIIDYNRIYEEFVEEIAPLFSVQEIGYDPFNATQFALQLQEAEFPIVEVRQGVQTMSEPAKIFEALIKSQRMRHGAHPVLRWNASNVAAKEDKKGNIFPYKPTQRKRIDGITAAVIAMSRLIAHPEAAGSAYDERGTFQTI